MKHRRLLQALTAAVLLAAAIVLSACSYKYESYHTDESVMGKVKINNDELTAYFFLLEDGSAILDLCNGEGKVQQSISFPNAGDYYASLDFDFAFSMAKFQDMNFDGSDDLYVPCSVTTENLEGMAWLWDSEEEKFILSEELSALYELTVYPDEELICSQDYSHPDGILCKEFKWEKGKLVQVGEYTVTMN